MDDTPAIDPYWSDLSWDDLEQWVGTRSLQRGRAYQRQGRVLALACSCEGMLSGRVAGTSVYETVVGPDTMGRLSSCCSCPLGGDCKHGVAVVLEYLERVKAGREVPTELPPSAVERFAAAQRAAPPSPADTESYLRGLSADELVALVLELADLSDDVALLLETRAELAGGAVEAVARSIREELERVSSEPGWRHYWSGQGYTPDYGLVARHLGDLLAAGEADVVLQLGEEVLRAGTEQVGMSDDEGETGMAISEALEPVWRAVGRSSLSPAQRILWVYDRCLQDEYDLCYDTEGADDVFEVTADVWSEVADALLARLESPEFAVADDRWAGHYRRGQISRWAIGALQGAERDEEALELAVAEAKCNDSYVHAVDLLIEAERREEARALAWEGIAATSATFPGIGAELRERLSSLAASEGDAAMVAALAADHFLRVRRMEAYRELRQAAGQVDLWEQVRAQVLEALQTGALPTERDDWPLPDTGLALELPATGHPAANQRLLVEIALDEGDSDEALRWFRQVSEGRLAWADTGLAERVAAAVGRSHPDEAVAIWQSLAEGEIARRNRSGYEASLLYLRAMRRLLHEVGREADWDDYLSALRAEHSRKRALLETLELLDEEGPILGS